MLANEFELVVSDNWVKPLSYPNLYSFEWLPDTYSSWSNYSLLYRGMFSFPPREYTCMPVKSRDSNLGSDIYKFDILSMVPKRPVPCGTGIFCGVTSLQETCQCWFPVGLVAALVVDWGVLYIHGRGEWGCPDQEHGKTNGYRNNGLRWMMAKQTVSVTVSSFSNLSKLLSDLDNMYWVLIWDMCILLVMTGASCMDRPVAYLRQ